MNCKRIKFLAFEFSFKFYKIIGICDPSTASRSGWQVANTKCFNYQDNLQCHPEREAVEGFLSFIVEILSG
ncbi:hypothetical protein [Chryseobacterium wanjuense]